ncbi:MAG: NADH:ubiquinone oxidoreductase subunit 6 [Candidatus Alkanophagales archaeon MCA70_species_2]|nr:NADH:ubiquinone oxidoreductase subunit 6 [Candidatus Alkanophaga liquidiphilum]RLG38862.1 MAG: hypothetical protein DRN91_01435 [Candidatus Alkanophagales archaeon]
MEATLLVLAGFAVLFALGVLLTKDNFYAVVFMSATMVLIAGIYAIFQLQMVSILIIFIFVGAIGMVTVVLAATYRREPERQFSPYWAVFTVVTAFLAAYYLLMRSVPLGTARGFELVLTSDLVLLITSMVTLIILVALSALRLTGGVSS